MYMLFITHYRTATMQTLHDDNIVCKLNTPDDHDGCKQQQLS